MRVIWAAVVVCLAIASAGRPPALGAGSEVRAALDDSTSQLTAPTHAIAVAPRTRAAPVPDRLAVAAAAVGRASALAPPRVAVVLRPVDEDTWTDRPRVHARASRGPPAG